MWFISAFPEIEKIFQNVGPMVRQNLWKIETLMKSAPDPQNLAEQWFGFSQEFAEEVIHKRISWKSENISKSGPKLRPKMMKNWNFNEKCIGSEKPHRTVFRFFAWYCDAEELIKKSISGNGENISKSGPKLGHKLCRIESLMKRCIGYAKLHRTVVRFFARYNDAEELIQKSISWNWENISKSGSN